MVLDDYKIYMFFFYLIINLCFYFMCGVKRDRVRKKIIDEFVYMSYFFLYIYYLVRFICIYYVRYEIYKD